MKIALVSLLLATAVSAQTLHVRVEGAGSPAVIFEAGFYDTMQAWAPVLPEIAKLTRVFAYDRAGLGESEPAKTPRTYDAIASELHAVLQRQKVVPPYVFVGHSFGGVIARAFTARYPNEVIGIVFVDPMTEAMYSKETVAHNVADQDERLRHAPAGVLAEWAFLKEETLNNYPILRAIPKPNVPMTLLVSRLDRPEGWTDAVLKQYGPWITERDDSSMFVTSNSSHYIQRDEPELVIDAIKSMLYPNPLGVLERAQKKGGTDAALAAFQSMRSRYPKGAITPRVLNSFGYAQLREHRVDDAVRIMALNADTFPDDANAYDSLGEAYAAKGDRAKALANYRKALQMNPANDNAKEWIARLEH